MGVLGDIWDFEKNAMGNRWDLWKEDPERAFLGINTPLESSLWGKVLNKDYEPVVDMFGGATSHDDKTAEAKGIRTGPGESMHSLAQAITSLFAGGALMNAFGGGGAAAGSAGSGAGAGGEVLAPTTAGVGGGVTAGSTGGGMSTATTTAPTASAGATTSTSPMMSAQNWMQLMNMFNNAESQNIAQQRAQAEMKAPAAGVAGGGGVRAPEMSQAVTVNNGATLARLLGMM